MTNLEGCQIPCLPYLADGYAEFGPQPLDQRLKRLLARVWNNLVKKTLKKGYGLYISWASRRTQKPGEGEISASQSSMINFAAGDIVRVRSRKEIHATLNPWKELRGCAFLESMWQYCGTTQRVLTPLEQFLDERDYKVKKVRGVVLLEGIICHGTPVFGRCDRCCHLFWRMEWLEKVDGQAV
jgi:hypothetical protein